MLLLNLNAPQGGNQQPPIGGQNFMGGGMNMPNFNTNQNQFGGGNVPRGGSPFMSQGHQQAYNNFNPQMGQLISNNIGQQLNTAANRLITAADRLMRSADALTRSAQSVARNALRGGGGGGGGGGGFGGGGGRRAPGTYGISNEARRNAAILSGAISGIGFALETSLEYESAETYANIGYSGIDEARMGLRRDYRQLGAKQAGTQQGITRGLGYGALALGAASLLAYGSGVGAPAGFALSAMAASTAFQYGKSSAQEEVDKLAFGRTRADVVQMYNQRFENDLYKNYVKDYQVNQQEQRLAQASATNSASFLRAKIPFEQNPQKKEELADLASSIDVVNNVSQQKANLERLSIKYTGMAGLKVSKDTLITNDTLSEFRTSLGMGTAEAAQTAMSYLSATGRAGGGGLSNNSIIAAIQNGIGAGELGASVMALRQGGGLTGLGFNNLSLINQANALNLRGSAAQNYINQATSLFGGYASRGVSNFSQIGVQNYNQFINRGRELGLRGFEGEMAFTRGQEIANLAQNTGASLRAMTGTAGQDILKAGFLSQYGSLEEAINAAEVAGPAELQKAARIGAGGDKTAERLAYYSAGLSGDVIKTLLETDFEKLSPDKKQLVEKGFAASAAAQGGVAETLEANNQRLISVLDNQTAIDVSNADRQFNETKLTNALLKELNEKLGQAKQVNQPINPTKTNPSSPNPIGSKSSDANMGGKEKFDPTPYIDKSKVQDFKKNKQPFGGNPDFQ